MPYVEFFHILISPWIAMPLVYFLWVTLFVFLKRILFKTIERIARNTKHKLDDILVQALDFPLTLLIFTSGAALVEQLMPVTADGKMTDVFLIGFKATTVIAIVLFADRFLNGLLIEYSPRFEILKTSGNIARGFVRLIVISLGVMILLDSFGVSVTPLLASLGIGSLAVALALQPTLENFFSGIQIIADKPFVLGHFIKLESGEEGYVHHIGWRSSWIRLLSNDVVVIPNKNLVNSRIINYYYPQTERAVLVEVGVHYNSDLEHVERVTVEVAKETLNDVPGGIKEFQPFIRYHTFDDFSINFSVILRVREFVDNYLIKHEFIKRLHKRYAREGITIPYPIEAVNFSQEKCAEDLKEKEMRDFRKGDKN